MADSRKIQKRKLGLTLFSEPGQRVLRPKVPQEGAVWLPPPPAPSLLREVRSWPGREDGEPKPPPGPGPCGLSRSVLVSPQRCCREAS